MLLKEIEKGRQDEEEEVSSYGVKKINNTEISEKRHCITLPELA
jgi:hypothetical protein